MKYLILLSLFAFYAPASCAINIPVLIWSHGKSPDIQAPLVGHSLTKDSFSKDYLGELLKEDNHNLLVFLQEKLSLDDISKFADVYSDNSDGASLHNLRELMESSSSLHLPSVASPAKALDEVKSSKKVTELTEAPYTIKDQLNKNGGNVVFVHLPKGDTNEELLKTTDSIIGSMSDEMKSLGQPFSAIYTGKQSSVKPVEKLYFGRRLLADEQATSYFFFNISDCIYFYASNITFSISPNGKSASNDTWDLPIGSLDSAQSECNKNGTSATLELSLKQPVTGLQSLKITFRFEKQATSGWWAVSNDTSVEYNADKAETAVLVADFIQAPLGYSYHCYEAPQLKGASNDSGAALTIRELQVQAFEIRSSKFGTANDCVGFFTIPIWAGIITTLILTLILTFGIIMLMNINTMDKFDDPKGKTITVNVSE